MKHRPIDKSALTIGAPVRVRSKEHLDFIREQPCLVCRARPVVAHHLTHAQPKARSLKAGDQWTVPMCDLHHRGLHAAGCEGRWWGVRGINAIEAAAEYWAISPARKALGTPENSAA